MTSTTVPASRCAFVGYADGPVEGVNCDRPKKLLTAGDVLMYSRCRKTDGTCEPCASSYRRDVGRVARRGLMVPGQSYFLTLTAPGEVAHCKPNGERCECTPDGGVELSTWNGECVARWNHLQRDLATLWGVERFEYFKAVEVQKRGALHLHVCIRVASVVRVQRSSVRRLVIHHGFGHSMKLDALTAGDTGAASYCAKYVAKSCTERDVVPFVNCRTGEIGPGRWRAWSSSRRWGSTMKDIRAEQLAWRSLNGLSDGNGDRTGAAAADTGRTAAAGGEAALDPYGIGYTRLTASPGSTGGVGPV